MSGVWTARQVLNAAQVDNRALQDEGAWYDERAAEHSSDLEAIDARIGEAWDHLGTLLVPHLEPPTLDSLARRIGLPAIGARAVEEGTQREVARQRSLIASAEAAPEYADREGLRNECEIRIAECDELLAPLHSVYAVIQQDLRFLRLRAAGYGTPAYEGRWWSLSYYRDWKEGDELVEAFGPGLKAADYPTLLQKIVEAEVAARTIQDERDQLSGRVNWLNMLEQQHRDATLALEQMPQRRLTAVRGAVRGHLQDLDQERLAALVDGSHEQAIALQRISGLAAKRRYLIEAAQRYIHEPRAQLGAVIQRNNRDLHKLARPKNAARTFEGDKMVKRFAGRPAAFAKRRERYAQTRDTITSFDSYERGSLASDFLWWDLMSDGRLDGDFISEVAAHRERYPEQDHANAVAAVASRDDTSDALLIHDGS